MVHARFLVARPAMHHVTLTVWCYVMMALTVNLVRLGYLVPRPGMHHVTFSVGCYVMMALMVNLVRLGYLAALGECNARCRNEADGGAYRSNFQSHRYLLFYDAALLG